MSKGEKGKIIFLLFACTFCVCCLFQLFQFVFSPTMALSGLNITIPKEGLNPNVSNMKAILIHVYIGISMFITFSNMKAVLSKDSFEARPALTILRPLLFRLNWILICMKCYLVGGAEPSVVIWMWHARRVGLAWTKEYKYFTGDWYFMHVG